jgi:hypothetical protein
MILDKSELNLVLDIYNFGFDNLDRPISIEHVRFRNRIITYLSLKCSKCKKKCELIRREGDLCCQCYDYSMGDEDMGNCSLCEASIQKQLEFLRRQTILTDFVK